MFGKKKSPASPLVLSAEKFDTLIGPQCEMHGRILATDSLRLDGRYSDEALAAQQAIADAHAELMVVVAYGLLLPEWTLHSVPHG